MHRMRTLLMMLVLPLVISWLSACQVLGSYAEMIQCGLGEAPIARIELEPEKLHLTPGSIGSVKVTVSGLTSNPVEDPALACPSKNRFPTSVIVEDPPPGVTVGQVQDLWAETNTGNLRIILDSTAALGIYHLPLSLAACCIRGYEPAELVLEILEPTETDSSGTSLSVEFKVSNSAISAFTFERVLAVRSAE